MISKTIGKKIMLERVSRGLTQQGLADLSGVGSKDTICRLEAGKPVNTKTLFRIMDALGVQDVVLVFV